MADKKPLADDLAAIRALAEVLDDTGLTEIEIERGPTRLRVSRAASATYVANAPADIPMQSAPAAAGGGGHEALSPAAEQAGAVNSPMVGTAYLAPSPGADPFVTVGDDVAEGQTVMIIEAMKTMNEIKAPHGGKVKKILARDSEPVEFGEALLIIA